MNNEEERIRNEDGRGRLRRSGELGKGMGGNGVRRGEGEVGWSGYLLVPVHLWGSQSQPSKASL